MTKLGVGTYAYAWAIGVPGYPQTAETMTALDFIRRASTLGLRVVQIADNLPLDALSEADLKALKHEADGLGIEIEVGTRGIAPDHLLQYIEIARKLDSRILRVVIDTATSHPGPDEIVSTLSSVLPQFEAAEIVLAIENHDRLKSRVLVELIRRLGSRNVGICLDTVNSFGAMEGPEIIIPTLAPYTVNLHMKDFSIVRQEYNLGFSLTGTIAGTGMLDIPWVLQQLADHNRSFNAILELWTAPESNLQATIAKEARWVEESIGFLRQYITDDNL